MEKIKMYIGGVGIGPGYTEQELHTAFGSLVQSQEQEELLCQEMSIEEFNAIYNPGDTSFSMIEEAVTFDSYTALKRGIRTLAKKFTAALGTSDITLVSHTQPEELKPRKNKMFAYVAVQFNFSDGQAVKVLFHSPRGEARSFDKDDELVSYAHSLNGRDVTHLFAEREGLTVAKFAKRMSQILEKNSEKFVAKQAKNAQMKADLETQTAASADLDLQMSSIEGDLTLKRTENEGLAAGIADLDTQIEQKETSCKNLRSQIVTAKADREAKVQAEEQELEEERQLQEALSKSNSDWTKSANVKQILDLTNVPEGTFETLLPEMQDYEDRQSVMEDWRDWTDEQLKAGKTFERWQESWNVFVETLPFEDEIEGEDVPGPSAEDLGSEPELPEPVPRAEDLTPNPEEIAATETAKAILAGDFDADLSQLEAKIDEIIDYLEANSPDLLDSVLQYNTDLLAKIAA
jgi:hypothetical protein